MLLLSLLLSSGGAHGALTTKELAAGQPSFLFILVSAATEPRGPCAGTERVQRVPVINACRLQAARMGALLSLLA